ncbi:hypothetical protein HZY86_01915 [Aerococcaceae bacterium DSM 111020]|nr:hypothetical protein [Aerococcaceae bacterium DSM 111020]
MEYEVVRELAEIKNILAEPNYIELIGVIGPFITFILGYYLNDYQNKQKTRKEENKQRNKVLRESINKLKKVEYKFKSTITPFVYAAPYLKHYQPDEIDDILIDCIVIIEEVFDDLESIEFSDETFELGLLYSILLNSRGIFVEMRATNDSEKIKAKEIEYYDINNMFIKSLEILENELKKNSNE